MEEKKSQENAIETVETIETAIDINGLSSKTENDILSRTKQHRENIYKIIVSQYIDDQSVEDNYAVTYSYKENEENSILGWTVNFEENGQQQPDLYIKLDKEYNLDSPALYKKTLILRCYKDGHYCKYLFRTSKYTLKSRV